MPRQKKDWKPFCINLATETYDKVDEYNKSTGLPKTLIVEKALEEWFKRHPIPEEKE